MFEVDLSGWVSSGVVGACQNLESLNGTWTIRGRCAKPGGETCAVAQAHGIGRVYCYHVEPDPVMPPYTCYRPIQTYGESLAILVSLHLDGSQLTIEFGGWAGVPYGVWGIHANYYPFNLVSYIYDVADDEQQKNYEDGLPWMAEALSWTLSSTIPQYVWVRPSNRYPLGYPLHDYWRPPYGEYLYINVPQSTAGWYALPFVRRVHDTINDFYDYGFGSGIMQGQGGLASDPDYKRDAVYVYPVVAGQCVPSWLVADQVSSYYRSFTVDTMDAGHTFVKNQTWAYWWKQRYGIKALTDGVAFLISSTRYWGNPSNSFWKGVFLPYPNYPFNLGDIYQVSLQGYTDWPYGSSEAWDWSFKTPAPDANFGTETNEWWVGDQLVVRCGGYHPGGAGVP